MEITARSFGYVEDDEDEVLEAGFSEHEDGSGLVLLLQATAHEPDEQEIRLGMDTYCLVSAGRTHYGGLRRVERDGDLVRFSFDADAVEVLELPAELAVRLDGPPEAVQRFFAGLPLVLTRGRETGWPELVGFPGRSPGSSGLRCADTVDT
ncbi:MAG: hypothetical protein HOY78_39595 [Saccharothrix sp.]|nr:hypothetical protein [Saccharothrix sp.]